MSTMRAVQVVGYHQDLEMTEVPVPEATGPFDVIVKIGGAGVCRTDLHILEGQWAEKSEVQLPYTIGHENAGWVHAVGSAVTNVAEGDKVIVHPLITCGLCRACRSGDDVHCEAQPVPRHRHERRVRRVPPDVGPQRRQDRRRRWSRPTSRRSRTPG